MPTTSNETRGVTAFISYAHEDERLRKNLEKHLSPLKRIGLISSWYDREIIPGTDWAREIGKYLNSSQLILLLISADFIASEFCYTEEMRKALERHSKGEACVIPIILRPVDWQRTPLGILQALPTDGKPITLWINRDMAFLMIVKGIEKAIEAIFTKGNLVLQDQDGFTAELPSKNELELSITPNTKHSKEILSENQSRLRRRVHQSKTTLLEIKDKFSDMQKIHNDDIAYFKHKVGAVNKTLRNIKSKEVIKTCFISIDKTYTNIEDALRELEVALFVLDQLNSGGNDITEIAKGVQEFYNSLQNCQSYLSAALQQFLI